MASDRAGAGAWTVFALVALLGVVDLASAWSGAAGSTGLMRISTGSVAVVYVLVGSIAMAHTLVQRKLACAFFDHALVTIVLVAAAWDLVSVFAFGAADVAPLLLHVLGGGSVVVLMGMLIAVSLPKVDAYANMVESVLES